MRRFRDIPIRSKVIIVTLLASLLALGSTMLVLLAYEALTFRENAVRSLATEADVIAVSTQSALDFDQPKVAEEILQTAKVNRQIIAACIYDKAGEIFAVYRSPQAGNYRFPPPEPDGHRFEKNSLFLFQTIRSGNERAGEVFLRYDIESVVAALHFDVVVFVGLAILLAGAAVLFAALLQRLITVPILNLARTARLVQEKKDFSVRVSNSSADELGALTQTFNDMLATIESSRNELGRYASELENRVDERTATLRENIAFLEGFCYSIAHDLRAPLRSMAGFADALQEEYGPHLDETGRGYAQRIVAAATRMDKLIMDLLVFGRLSQIDLTFAELDLNSEMEKVLNLLHDEATSRKAVIEIEGRLPSVWANATVLEQVLVNLIGNAIKFTAPGVTPRVRVGAFAEDGYVRLCIQDNGIGIATAHQERIFRVFERLHTEGEYSGTGIGLAIVKKGVERMKGRVWVESEPGKGSRFWIELPQTAAAHGQV